MSCTHNGEHVMCIMAHITDKALGSVSLWLTGMFVCPFMPCGTPSTITFHVALSSMLTWAPVKSPLWKPRVKAKTGLTWDVLGGFAPQQLKSVTWIAFSFETFAILVFTIAALSSTALGIIQMNLTYITFADDRRNTLRPSSQGGIAVLLCFQNTVR